METRLGGEERQRQTDHPPQLVMIVMASPHFCTLNCNPAVSGLRQPVFARSRRFQTGDRVGKRERMGKRKKKKCIQSRRMGRVTSTRKPPGSRCSAGWLLVVARREVGSKRAGSLAEELVWTVAAAAASSLSPLPGSCWTLSRSSSRFHSDNHFPRSTGGRYRSERKEFTERRSQFATEQCTDSDSSTTWFNKLPVATAKVPPPRRPFYPVEAPTRRAKPPCLAARFSPPGSTAAAARPSPFLRALVVGGLLRVCACLPPLRPVRPTQLSGRSKSCPSSRSLGFGVGAGGAAPPLSRSFASLLASVLPTCLSMCARALPPAAARVAALGAAVTLALPVAMRVDAWTAGADQNLACV
ncbi:hypothetical protein HPB48_008640 [Haemaphysalis longicornis]|uniref:Uncharacterized protein n=1 Tax=Haemaphysalis longicornis TaxID=44386 RepID=A0A9J6H610_HAELO|nr:hypothetical protein HPB48_008640 [Haemaphysalis longicornis]